MSITVQETSRQLERLADARLISKGPESRYTITSLGKVAVSLLPSFKFAHDESDFLLTHDLSALPVSFVHRLGELSVHQNINRMDEALAHAEEVIKGARKYFWGMADQSVRQSFPHEHPSGIDFRMIFPKDIGSETLKRLRGRIGPALQIAKIDRVVASIIMNEKTAAVYFLGTDGRMDLTRGFVGEDSAFHGWCEDLYSFYWSRGRAGYPD
jgi:predicted transcriptional regulator